MPVKVEANDNQDASVSIATDAVTTAAGSNDADKSNGEIAVDVPVPDPPLDVPPEAVNAAATAVDGQSAVDPVAPEIPPDVPQEALDAIAVAAAAVAASDVPDSVPSGVPESVPGGVTENAAEKDAPAVAPFEAAKATEVAGVAQAKTEAPEQADAEVAPAEDGAAIPDGTEVPLPTETAPAPALLEKVEESVEHATTQLPVPMEMEHPGVDVAPEAQQLAPALPGGIQVPLPSEIAPAGQLPTDGAANAAPPLPPSGFAASDATPTIPALPAGFAEGTAGVAPPLPPYDYAAGTVGVATSEVAPTLSGFDLIANPALAPYPRNIGMPEVIIPAKWVTRYEELKRFVEEHGHTNVPQKYKPNPQLGAWVRTQKQQYKLLQDGKSSHMTHARLEMLNQLGFEWSGEKRSKFWIDRYNELVQYHMKYGTTRIADKCDEFPQLGSWVAIQRRELKLYKENKKSKLTPERVQMLDAVGLEYNIRNSCAWMERYLELKAYKDRFGDCNVPQKWKGNPSLGRWVDNQKTQHKKLYEGKSTHLTIERIQLLVSIGFSWR